MKKVQYCILFSGYSEDSQTPDQYLLEGAAALAMHLKKWTQRKDVRLFLLFSLILMQKLYV